MKRNFIICSLLTVAMLLVPLAVMKKDTDKPVSGSTETFEDTGYISVMKSENGKVEKLSQKEYIVGVLAAETDMNYHDEALKAQAVASYTYALYMKRQGDKNDLNGADLSDDPQIHQGYLDEAQRKEKWGDDFEINETKAGKIADQNVSPRRSAYRADADGRQPHPGFRFHISHRPYLLSDVVYAIWDSFIGDSLDFIPFF